MLIFLGQNVVHLALHHYNIIIIITSSGVPSQHVAVEPCKEPSITSKYNLFMMYCTGFAYHSV